jgi:large repetitive protein
MRLKLTLLAALAVAAGFAIPVVVSVSAAQATTVDPTTTSISGPCTENVALGETVSCTATVFDFQTGATTPTGTVNFTSDTTGGTFADGGSCTLSPAIDLGQAASCSVSYTSGLLSPGTEVITASYGGDSGHSVSTGQATMTVTLQPTSLTLTCSPTTIAIGQATSCTAAVTETVPFGATTPTGTVSFTDGTHKGNFTSVGSCTLAAIDAGLASCSLTFYTPPQLPCGSQTITASYSGDGGHSGSGDEVHITVTFRVTSTNVSCQEVLPVLSRCTATVSDISPGTATAPAGPVFFTSSGPGVFFATQCTLVASGTSALCTVEYATPEGVPFAGQIITAIYEEADAIHFSSVGSTALN